MNDNENDTLPPENAEGITDAPEPAEGNPPPVWSYAMVMAEVIFNCELGIQSRRVQFVSRADVSTYPASRLTHLQQLAAQNVINEMRAGSNGAIQKIEVDNVYLLGVIDCGWMTEEDFLGPAVQETTVAPDETPAPDNVVPLR